MAAVLVGILSMTTAFADISNANARDSSNTDTENNNKQTILASGINAKAQNCNENNINSQNTAGDEGLDCHNSQDDTQANQNASD
jgi:uncharacterized protein (UPF0333 family)